MPEADRTPTAPSPAARSPVLAAARPPRSAVALGGRRAAARQCGRLGRLGQLAWLLLAAGACAPEPATLQLDVVHDLYALFGTAAVSSCGLDEDPPQLLFRLVYLDNSQHDERDALACLHAPTPTTITWPALATEGPARLRFGTGIAKPTADDSLPPAWGPVRFLVQARDELAVEFGYTTLFDETLDPATLAGPAHVRWHELVLPERPRARWSLRLLTESAPGSGDWAGWFSPQLRSTGQRRTLAETPVTQLELHHDLLDTLGLAEVLAQRDDDPVRAAVIDAAPAAAIFGGRRSLVQASAPARLRWTLDLPASASLEFAVGLDPSAWSEPGDGMRFSVALDGSEVWAQRLDPRAHDEDRGWHPARVDLSAWGGRRVALELRTDCGPEAGHLVGGFAQPRLMVRHETLRLPAGERPNLLLIVMDTLRADRLGCYGNRNQLTPRLDALALRGLRFDQARSIASYTWPSTASLLTGLAPQAHGVLGFGQAWLLDRAETLAELCAAAGYTTAAFVANPLIGQPAHFEQGFETFVSAPGVRGRALNERVALWLEGRQGLAHFTYVHYFDPHSPYRAPPGFQLASDAAAARGTPGTPASVPANVPGDDEAERQRVIARLPGYHGEVRYMDTVVGELLDTLRERGLLENTYVIITSDHGEEFYEHRSLFHGPHLYDESLRVPLLLLGFGEATLRPGVVPDPVQLVDVLPTFCALAGLPLPSAPLQGRSLLAPRPAGLAGTQYFFSAYAEEPGIPGRTLRLGVLAAPWKLIRTPASGRSELYRLDQDPLEQHDLAAREPEVRQQLEQLVQDWSVQSQPAEPMRPEESGVSPEQLWWMQQLGYVEAER